MAAILPLVPSRKPWWQNEGYWKTGEGPPNPILLQIFHSIGKKSSWNKSERRYKISDSTILVDPLQLKSILWIFCHSQQVKVNRVVRCLTVLLPSKAHSEELTSQDLSYLKSQVKALSFCCHSLGTWARMKALSSPHRQPHFSDANLTKIWL